MSKKQSLYDYLKEDKKNMIEFLVAVFDCEEEIIYDFVSFNTRILDRMSDKEHEELTYRGMLEALLDEEKGKVRL